MQVVYGACPGDLVDVPAGAQQVSPRVPGARDLADVPDATLSGLAMLAPQNVLERRHEMALALTKLAPMAPCRVLAANKLGGGRLAKELQAFGCQVLERSKQHHRIIETQRPADLIGTGEAIAAGGAQWLPDLDLWSQPGLFSWNRLDPGSALLIAHLPTLEGRGLDLGCGIGILSRAVLQHHGCRSLTLADIDRRAIAMAKRNITDLRAHLIQADIRQAEQLARLPHAATGYDFVVMNPPFHANGQDDTSLGMAFIRAAHATLQIGGELWMTANRHLPYEALVRDLFSPAQIVTQVAGFKIIRAVKAARNKPGNRAKRGQDP